MTACLTEILSSFRRLLIVHFTTTSGVSPSMFQELGVRLASSAARSPV